LFGNIRTLVLGKVAWDYRSERRADVVSMCCDVIRRQLVCATMLDVRESHGVPATKHELPTSPCHAKPKTAQWLFFVTAWLKTGAEGA
jgi:hypothetical protein